MFSRSDLDELVPIEARPAVSLYLPTHVAGREIRQDSVRFKHLLSQAAERLRTVRRGTDTDAFLASARQLMERLGGTSNGGLSSFSPPASSESTSCR